LIVLFRNDGNPAVIILKLRSSEFEKKGLQLKRLWFVSGQWESLKVRQLFPGGGVPMPVCCIHKIQIFLLGKQG